MAQDLQTNLILNDKQFTDGLRRAEGGLSSFGSKVRGLSAGMRGGLALGGMTVMLGAVVDAYAKIQEAQARINAGVETFEDLWISSRGMLGQVAAEMPIIGQYLDKLERGIGGFEKGRIAFDASKRSLDVSESLRERLALARATTSEEREYVRINNQYLSDRKTIAELERQTGVSHSAQKRNAQEIRDIDRQRARDLKDREETEKSIAEYTKQQADNKAMRGSGDSFYDMVEAEQIKALRRFGLDEEANARDINLEVAKRRRDLENDPTVNTRDPELMRRKLLVSMLAALEGEKPNPDDNAQNIGVGSIGSASLLGQFFAPGAMNEQKREQKRLGDTAQAILKQIEIIARKRDNPSMYN